MSRPPRSLDRVNPVLVKEVRQAVRGRSFRGSFILSLAVSAIVSAVVLANLDVNDPSELAQSGTRMFFALHLVFLFCTLIAVPVQAHRSMAMERDERTFDALLISGLSPAQIVLGKWLSAGITIGLFLVAMLPFFATAATLYGLDLLVALMLTLLGISIGLTLSLLGILAAAMAKTKAAGSILMMVFLGACGFALMALANVGNALVFFGSGFGSTSEFLVAMGLMIAASFFSLLWLHGLAVASISHPEENGFLRVRWAGVACSIFLGIAPLIMATVVPFGTPARMAFPLLVASLPILVLLNMPTMTESTGMKVRCRYQIESGRWRRFGTWLFLPGGGSGYVLFLIQLVIAGAPTMIYLLTMPYGPVGLADRLTVLVEEGLGAYLTALGVTLACCSFPAFLASRPNAKPWARSGLRFFLVTSPLWIILVLGVLTLLFRLHGNTLVNSVLNPFWAVDQNFNSLEAPGAIAFWWMLGLLGSFLMLITAASQLRSIRKLRREASQP
ncbi:MAG: hypothetical protein CMJ94_14155 [Planctomycetes bacterium]|nr:hypothetical protein [Planctomycetota bacterium]